MRLPILAFAPIMLFAQPPALSPRPSGYTQGQKYTEDQRYKISDKKGTQSASSVAISSTGARHSSETRAPADSSSSDWWLIIPTVVIAVATIAQAFIYGLQTGQMKRGLAQTTRAADAAEKSAETAGRALTLLERAEVSVMSVKTVVPISMLTYITAELQNHGRTIAKNVRVRLTLIVPAEFDKKTSIFEQTFPEIPVISPIRPLGINFGPAQSVPNRTFDQINQGALELMVAVWICYDDVFGNSHAWIYGGVYNRATGEFLIQGDSA